MVKMANLQNRAERVKITQPLILSQHVVSPNVLLAQVSRVVNVLKWSNKTMHIFQQYETSISQHSTCISDILGSISILYNVQELESSRTHPCVHERSYVIKRFLILLILIPHSRVGLFSLHSIHFYRNCTTYGEKEPDTCNLHARSYRKRLI